MSALFPINAPPLDIFAGLVSPQHTPFGYSKSPALYCKPVVTRFSEIFQRSPDRAIQEVSSLSPMQAASKQVMKKIFATPPSPDSLLSESRFQGSNSSSFFFP